MNAQLELPLLIAQGLWTGWLMFWATLWPLALGFSISGVVQACASRSGMERIMGNHRPGAVVRASALGMLSSSCSYAASAMSKNLFAKGADFITAQVFMLASTNLVIEIGLVLIVLLGWPFAAAEFIGGPIMIVLLAWWGATLFPHNLTHPAQERLREGSTADQASEAAPGMSGLRTKLSTPATWANAAGYTLADLTMLRKELLIGFVVAGLLTTVVPDAVWRVVFLQNQGIWTSIQNAFIGPLVAVISFVCSVGNVAMAAALWTGGVSFGGVIAFIFGDLITLPLVLIYRKYYGPKLALRLMLSLWLLMSISGLMVEGLFHVAGWIPSVRTHAGQSLAMGWNTTTWLNVLALTGMLLAWWMARHKERFGGGSGYAIDPVCGMQVEKVNAPATRERAGQRFWFCSDHCAEHFDQSGDTPSSAPVQANLSPSLEANVLGKTEAKDPVCGMTVTITASTPHRRQGKVDVWFCSTRCADAFDQRN